MESSASSVTNSFLIETEYNSEIGSEIRKDINEKFQKSKVNLLYVFPRSKVFLPKKKITSYFSSPMKIVKLQRCKSKKNCIVSKNISLIKPKLLPQITFPKLKSQNSSTNLDKSHKRILSYPELLRSRIKNSPYCKPVNPSSKINLFRLAK